jgi:signal transduction histidine kinase/CheY-like chemotaxis protein
MCDSNCGHVGNFKFTHMSFVVCVGPDPLADPACSTSSTGTNKTNNTEGEMMSTLLAGIWEYDTALATAHTLIRTPSPSPAAFTNNKGFTLQQWRTLVHTDDLNRLEFAIQESVTSAVVDQVTSVEYRMSGQWVRDELQVIHIDPMEQTALKLLINRTNITKEKSLEERLKFAEARFKVLLSLAPLGVFQTNIDGNVTYQNRIWAEFGAGDSENPPELASKWYDVVEPAVRNETAQKWQKFTEAVVRDVIDEVEFSKETSFAQKEPFHFDELLPVAGAQNESHEHKERTLRVKIFPFPGDNSESVPMLGLALDITSELEVQKLKNDIQTKSDFFSHISHEMRTPLHGILGYAELLKMEKKLVPEHRDRVRTIWECGSNLLELINNMLDFSKMESGKLEIVDEPFELKDCIDYVMKVMLIKARPKSLNIKSAISPNTPHSISGDSSRLNQVLLNLVGNAVKFTQTGSVSLDVSVLSPSDMYKIPTGTEIELLFRITDTGIGIQPEVIQFLFQPFAQASAQIYRQFGGTGLGLSISKSLVEKMGGRIWIQESVIGKGSVFCFTIKTRTCSEERPVVQTVAEKFRISAAAPSPVGSPVPVDNSFGHRYPLKILIVEDNNVNQRLCVDMLKRLGFTNVHVVSNGRDAVEQVSHSSDEVIQQQRVKRRNIGGIPVSSGVVLPVEVHKPYDVILMDILMPIMDGFEATKRIRELPTDVCPIQPTIIAFTAGAQRSELDKCIESGMDDCLTKPIKFSQLTAMMEKVFEKRLATSLSPNSSTTINRQVV